MSSPEPSTDKKDVTSATATDVAEAPEAKEEPKVEATKEAESNAEGDASKDDTSPEKPTEPADAKPDTEKAEASSAEKKDEEADTEMKDAATEGGDATPAADAKEETAAADKTKAARRKSTGATEKGKKLNRKQSKARITNLNAQPGDHYLVKLKGFPPWPAVICDEVMLPQLLLTTRPVTAKRADGTYREDFADGGKRVNDRTFPVMYLYTNEFGWVPNTSLQELSPEQASEAINDKMRKDLQAAYELAAEGHDLDYYKDLLQQFQEELVAKEEAKKSKKSKAAAADSMDIDEVEDATPAKKSKKRKAEEETATPQRSDSVKKPKIKLLNSAAKVSNGGATPKPSKEQAAPKPSKSKSKPSKPAEETRRPELTPEERHERKSKEVLYLRHKLQKGFFPRDAVPKEEDMQSMSEFFTRLERFTEMDASILRATRIHKVPRAILRMESIPREEEFNFKSRSQGLLDQWNKLLAAEPAPVEGGSNGVNGKEEKKAAKPESNGADEKAEKASAGEKASTEPAEKKDDVAETKSSEAPEEETKAPAAVEASA